MWLILILLASIFPPIYWYLTRNFNYWSKRGIAGPKPVPLFGNILQQYLIPQPVQDVKWNKQFGKIYGYYMGNTPVLTVADPQLIKTIMVKDFHLFHDRRPNLSMDPIMNKNLVEAKGDDWKRIRSIASPTFTSGKIKRMYPLIMNCLNDFMKHLGDLADKNSDIDAKHMYGNYTMDVIATCAFATKTNAHKELDSPFVVNARRIFNFNIFNIIVIMILPKFMLKYVIKFLRNDDIKQAREFFIGTTKQIMDNRRKSDNKYHDFVQLLMDAEKVSEAVVRDETDVHESHHINEGEDELESEKRALSGNLANKHLTEDEILAQAFVFFLAGYETTATTLTYCTYELALSPDVQQRLYEEVIGAMDQNGQISYEVLVQLPYLDAVLSETLRLHSPAIRIARLASSDYKLGNTGITLEKGQLVEIPIFAMHHSNEYFPEPFKFDPDRFMPENRNKITPYTYLPFGAGPRNCIGMRFALVEAKLALAHIISKYQFSRSSQTDVPLKPKRVFRLNTPNRVIVTIGRRQTIN